MSFVSSSWLLSFFIVLLFTVHTSAFTSSEYRLDAEYSGTNFFEGWDFYSDRDPTGGTVTYYSRESAELTGLISSSDDGPAYMRANYVDTLPFDNITGSVTGAGRPSIRIASKQAWTHGLFIGDFQHIPAGICGTWPAFWTLGPNWPYTGEIDILEGVNLNTGNVMSLHTNETCTIQGDSSVMTGSLGNTNCAYYPDYNVGCGVSDPTAVSYSKFNQAQGGIYAMQWTSEYIRIWQWSRDQIPSDVENKTPDPSSWGLPTAQLGVGNCTIDQHFQNHKVIFDLTFCGAYAGYPSVWNSNDDNSCSAYTGLATCDDYVANNPQAFKDAYWSVNYVRVYQLVDPDATTTATSYVASEQPVMSRTVIPDSVATPNIDVDSLCPQYNYTVITDGTYHYEIACDVDVPGPDIIGDPYYGFRAHSLTDCLKGCSYMNTNNGTNSCGGVIHYAAIDFCYFKRYFDQPGIYRPGYNEVRLIYYGYPQITDYIGAQSADSTATTTYVDAPPTPQIYRGTNTPTVTTTVSMYSTSSGTISVATTVGAPAMGQNSTMISTMTGVGSDYSQTVTEGYNSTSVASSVLSTAFATYTITYENPTASTSPEATNGDFYISLQTHAALRLLSKKATQYLSFDQDGKSTLVTSESEATRFHLDTDENLITSGPNPQYVSVDTDVEPPRLSLQSTKPAQTIVVNVNENGSVSFSGVESYCLTTSGNVAVVASDEDQPDNCRTLAPELVSAPEISTTSSISTALAGSQTTSTTVTASVVIFINDFIYAGCFGVPETFAPVPGISAPYSNSSMTNELCTSHCKSSNTVAYFAATYNDTCFCASTLDLYSALIAYPDPACSVPCPGANREICGGNSSTSSSPATAAIGGKLFRTAKRQNALLLLSLYNNTDLLAQSGGSTVTLPLINTNSGTGTSTGTVNAGSATMTNSLSSSSSSSSASLIDGVPTSFPLSAVSYDVTGTNTATVLSTTYIDVCNFCPGGLTTIATTITLPHCGCAGPTASFSFDHILQTAVPAPTFTAIVPAPIVTAVPMITTTKQCACGVRGAQSIVTLTVPHEASIAALMSSAAAATDSASAFATVTEGNSYSHSVPNAPMPFISAMTALNAGSGAMATQPTMSSALGSGTALNTPHGDSALISMPIATASAMQGNYTLPLPVPSTSSVKGPVGILTYVSTGTPLERGSTVWCALTVLGVLTLECFRERAFW